MSVRFFVDIDKILEGKRMTLTQLADKTGIDKGHLSRIRSTKRITFGTLNKLASALNETDLNGLVSAEIKSSGKILN
ncbi:helix-turn-helix domain-containing protein [Bacillus hwajinpoensis]|uniref:Helix-turn-helix domain-containing protein n=1 Tax=Guptibacillus hwajinpoensis TaxID=208199 RepID=A0A845F3Q7_9BACL|nr:helix-turn-helix transcriptional regulator [Pseudalkalibacillus hwajinpoensis]MYL65439.1 helix-turn-helix domain-containing protein [Pseudalkalibacillus hwajinpoensis]